MALPTLPISGGCACGQARYTLSALPLSVYNCHCKDCQRYSGTGWGMSMIVDDSIFAVTGEIVSFERKADSGNVVRRNFCAQCFGWLWNDPARPGQKVVRAGTLDDVHWAKPVGNIWTDSAADWAVIDPKLVNFPKGPADRTPLYEAFAAAHGL